jgi:hypothetical protein
LRGLTHGLYLPQFHLKRFPNTLATEYLKRTGINGRNDETAMIGALEAVCPGLRTKLEADIASEDVLVGNVGLGHVKLADCFDTRPHGNRIAKPTKGTALVHLRVGDVNGTKGIKGVFYRFFTGVVTDKYKAVAKRAKEDGIKRVVLVGGVHQTPDPDNLTSSVLYVRTVAQHFMNQGIPSVMISNTPDIDMCLLADAPYYVYVSKSGFSQIAAFTGPRTGNKKRTIIDACSQ